jgi:hypothetical protein
MRNNMVGQFAIVQIDDGPILTLRDFRHSKDVGVAIINGEEAIHCLRLAIEEYDKERLDALGKRLSKKPTRKRS